MWTDEERQRYNFLREREQAAALTDAEQAELATLIQEISDREVASYSVANERKAQEIAAMEAEAERLELQNRLLREYLSERQLFLKRVRSLVAGLRAEDRHMRERFAAVLPLLGEPSTREPS